MTPAAYLAALDRILAALLLAIRPRTRAVFRTGLTADNRDHRVRVATEGIVPLIRAARRQVYALTEQYMRDQAEAQVGMRTPFIPALAGYSDQAVTTTLNRAIDDYLAGERVRRSSVTDRLDATFVRHAQQAGRQTIEDAVEPIEDAEDDTVEDLARDEYDGAPDDEPDDEPTPEDEPEAPWVDPLPEDDDEREDKNRPDRARDKRRPVAWARTLTGADNCAFCVMLASRGAVYKSATSASRDGDGQLYHDHCDCVPVPVYSSKEWAASKEGRQADAAYAFWLKATAGHFQRDAINAFRRALSARARKGAPPFPGFKPLRPAK